MKCDIIRDLMPQYINGSASGAGKKAVEAHITVCDECCDELARLEEEKKENESKPTDADKVKELAHKLEKQEALIIVMFLILLGYFLYALKYRGITLFCEEQSQETSEYTTEEMDEAFSLSKMVFKEEFRGCILTKLEYDEEKSQKAGKKYKKKKKADKVMVLNTKFVVIPWSSNDKVISGEAYGGWECVLVKQGNKPWRIEKWGFYQS